VGWRWREGGECCGYMSLYLFHSHRPFTHHSFSLSSSPFLFSPSDDLVKVDFQIESLVKRVERQYHVRLRGREGGREGGKEKQSAGTFERRKGRVWNVILSNSENVCQKRFYSLKSLL